MKTIVYYPSNHDATEEQISQRITEYLGSVDFQVTRGDSRSVTIEFELDLTTPQLKDLDSALISFGFQRF